MSSQDEHNAEQRSSEIQEHLSTCPECSKKARSLDAMMDSLGEHRDVFCPETWELYDYATQREDSSGEIRYHVERCARCRETISAFEAARNTPGPVPPGLLRAVDKHHRHEDPKEGLVSRIATYLASLFRLPVMAVATAAAAVIVAVFLYPRDHTETIVALSPVTWGKIPGLTLMGPSKSRALDPGQSDDQIRPLMSRKSVNSYEDARKRTEEPERGVTGPQKKLKAAMVVIIRDRSDRWPQERIDSLYEALKPTKEMRRSFDFVTPGEVQKTLGQDQKGLPAKDIVMKLRQNLGAENIWLINITARRDSFDILSELLDGKTSQVVKKREDKSVAAADLLGRVSQSVQSLQGTESPSR